MNLPDSQYACSRRDEITAIIRDSRAMRHEAVIKYANEEHLVWNTINDALAPLHESYATGDYLKYKHLLRLPADHIPELSTINRALKANADFSLYPVEGLLDSRTFLAQLGERSLACTLYIRESDQAAYTSEPDIVHEIIGHAPMICHPGLGHLLEFTGHQVPRLSAESLTALERLYWFTIEAGLIHEQGTIKAYGATLLSSTQELRNAFSANAVRRTFDLNEVLGTPIDYSHLQSVLYVVPSFEFIEAQFNQLLRSF